MNDPETTKEQIEQWLDEIESSVAETDPVRRWQSLVERTRELPCSFAPTMELLWKRCREQDPFKDGIVPIWFPSNHELTCSNVTNWMAELEIQDYSSFHSWTTANRGEFWQQAVDRLGIRFRQRSKVAIDLAQGADKPAWFPGATLNIAESCFQAGDDSIAIIAQRPGSPIRHQTLGELRSRSNQVANSLVDAGFKVGDAIGVVMPMTDWSIAIYLGIVMSGCYVVSIADSFAPPEIATRLNIAGAKAVFTYDHQRRAGKQLPLFRRVAEASEIPAIVLSADETLSTDMRDQDWDWSEFLVDRTDFEPVECGAQETINILFSSGTTGDPKAIPWNHLTPIKCAVDGFCHQNIQAGDVCAWPTNLGWMMGPWLIFASLINKATIAIYEDAPTGPGFGEFVQNANVTMLGVVPTIVKAWQSSGELEAFDWSTIKTFSSTGESSQPDTMVYLSSLADMKPVIEYCGGTEIGGGYVSSVVVLPNVPATFNTPSVGLDFILFDQALENVSDEGEVFLIPPSIGLSSRLINRDHFETYYAGTPQIPGHGPLRRHGDFFRRLQTSFGPIYVAGGRADDTMNLGGIKISSAEIERVFNNVGDVVESAAVAHSEFGGPDQLVVFVVAEPNTEEQQLHRRLNQVLKSQLNPLFRVDAVKLIPAMPRTASGKVMRRKLRNLLRDPPD